MPSATWTAALPEGSDDTGQGACKSPLTAKPTNTPRCSPGFRKTAELEGQAAAAAEMDDGQIAESKEHAERFAATLAKAQKRFALRWPKWRSVTPNQYEAQLATVKAQAKA